jgi:type IV secretion system protein VirD4
MHDRLHPQPNKWFLVACAFYAMARWLWPEPGAYFGQHVLAWVLAVAAAAGLSNALSSLRLDYFRRKRRAESETPSGAHGQGRFATVFELLSAGFLDPAGRMLLGQHASGAPVFLPAGLMAACQAITGGGKTSSLAIGAIFHALMTGLSVVVTDLKPEMVHLWADRLRRLGFRVLVNNPAQIDGLPHDGDMNPFRILIDIMADLARHTEAFLRAESFAQVLIKDAESDKNGGYFKQIDRSYFVFAVLALAAFYPEFCTPAGVQKMLADPRAFKNLLAEAANSDILQGDLAALARSLMAKAKDNPEHADGGLTGAANALSVFKPSTVLGRVGMDDVISVADLRDADKPPAVIFDIMPADQAEVFARAHALQMTARLAGLKRHREGRGVVLLCDEATNFPVPTIVSDIELMRSFKVTVALFYQSYSSLERVYGKDQAASIRASSAEIYMGVGDLATAEEISRRVGEMTIKSRSYGFGEDGASSLNIGEVGRRVLPPEEILSLDKSAMIVLAPNSRPILLKRTPWFEVEPYKSLAGENPHERHPRSPITRFTLRYGKDASALGAPVVPGLEGLLKRAKQAEAKAARRKIVPLVGLSSLRWVPVVAAAAIVVATRGEPHVLFGYQAFAGLGGGYTCTYFGADGLRAVETPGKCPAFRLIRPDTE